jgi:NAD(P)H-hydrate epimerase
MIPVLTKEQAYKLDKDTIESGHLSKEELMDNAGKAVAQFFCEKIDNPFKQKVVVVCGKGNNGGDGVIAHSYLKKYNVSSKIVFTEKKHGNSNLIKKYKISKNDFSIYNDKIKFDKYDWIIDGIFGIGLSIGLNKKYIQIIENINKNKNTISIDISSGISADGDSFVYNVKSKFTLTFGYSKLGHYLEPINNLFIADIGFKSISTSIQKIEFSDITNILKGFNKKNNVHKYTKGTCQIIAGSYIYPGASILCSLAAQKTGSGYVHLFFDDPSDGEEYINNINCQLSDIIVSNYVNHEYKDYLPTLVGPGRDKSLFFSQYEEEYKQLDMNNKYVIDAGEIYPDGLHQYPEQSIITPHIGEINTLMPDLEIYEDSFNRYHLEEVQEAIDKKIIILKSFNTFIITDDMIYIMDKGSSLLATAGTGDVLSGILVSLLSQGYSRLDASILGTYLHAEAANFYMNNISRYGMTASNLIDCIPMAFNILRNND